MRRTTLNESSHKRHTSPRRLVLSLLTLGLALGGIQAQELKINEVRESEKRELPLKISDADRFGAERMMAQLSGGSGMPNAGPSANNTNTGNVQLGGTVWSFEYELPTNWQEVAATQFRNPNLVFGAKKEGQCYVTVLSGTGGGIAENVNRWRGQMGLPKLGEAELSDMPTIDLLGKPATYLELKGDFSGMMGGGSIKQAIMLGALAEIDGHAIFVKCVAPETLGEKERDHFKQFVASLKQAEQVASADPHSHADGNPHADDVTSTTAPAGMVDPHSMGMAGATVLPPGGGQTGSDRLSWNTPEGWVARNDQTMRVVGFHVPGDAGEGDCGVFLLPGVAGGMDANINRWRRQMGLPPASADEIKQLPKAEIAGQSGKLVDLSGTYTGMQGGPQQNSGLLGVICELKDETLFVKLTGPAATVKTVRKTFLTFCEELKLK